ncbi:MAG: BlaI/MecI/CopY family transcriptional regulator [Thermoanaerobaculia bacterium]
MSQRKHQLGDLQLAIMRVLWRQGEATVRQVQDALEASRPLALTTVATMLTKMESKGVVGHRAEGRRYVYRPLVSERQVRRSMVRRLTEGLFAGDSLAVVSHLLSEREIPAAELAELKRMIQQREREEEES